MGYPAVRERSGWRTKPQWHVNCSCASLRRPAAAPAAPEPVSSLLAALLGSQVGILYVFEQLLLLRREALRLEVVVAAGRGEQGGAGAEQCG